MRTLLIFFLCFLFIYSKGQNYAADLIPDSLKKNANAVKRSEELRLIIKSPSHGIIRHRVAITILNEAGDKFARYENSYGRFFSNPDISGTLYDAMGKQVKTIKKKDISDLPYNDRISIINDERIKTFSFYYKQYPYTVEYTDEQEMKGIFFLPSWKPVEDEYLSVQNSKFIVETPKDYQFRYKQFYYNSKPLLEGNICTWEINNIPAIEKEPFSSALSEITPTVIIAPNDFEVGDYKGNMSNWSNLGKFIEALRLNRDQLPDNVKRDVHLLTDHVADRERKVKILYEYLQRTTRYISIQLGIGGWQPFDANYVASNGYGDCKALSNYMTALLKEVGIKSNYVLIRAGDRDKGLWEDFPSPYFNHAIMCVPGPQDTLWMECTSQTTSFDYMGSFTGNRKALLIDEDGGHVVSTPHYSALDNTQMRKITASVDSDGNLLADINTTYRGIEQELQQEMINGLNKESRQKYLNNMFDIPTYSIDNSEYEEFKSKIPVVKEKLKLSAPNYASVTGKRLFIQPNLLEKVSIKLDDEKKRKFPIVYSYSFLHEDSTIITLQEKYEPESLPKNLTLNNKFGKYSINYKVSGNKIAVTRLYERKEATYPATDYPEFVRFYEQIKVADNSRIVLVRKEE